LHCERSLLAVLNFFHRICCPPRLFEEEALPYLEAAYTRASMSDALRRLLFN
jgi:hypothetical protein